MKTKKIVFFGLLTLVFSGCVVFSFYPLYTSKDLFPNDLLTGEWEETKDTNVKFNDEKSSWKFQHPKKKDGGIDSCCYILTYTTKEDSVQYVSEFEIHIIKLKGVYFLDFYLKNYPEEENIGLSSFHLIPVHTFAQLLITDKQLKIKWFDPDWLEKLIKENKIRIRHEQDNDIILLTAKPQELQKFVSKYVNSEDAFKEGLQVVLKKKDKNEKK